MVGGPIYTIMWTLGASKRKKQIVLFIFYFIANIMLLNTQVIVLQLLLLAGIWPTATVSHHLNVVFEIIKYVYYIVHSIISKGGKKNDFERRGLDHPDL